MLSALRSAGSHLAFVLASILLALALLAVLEGALRIFGIGDPCPGCGSRLGYQQIYLPIFEPAERADGTPTLRPADKRVSYHSLLRDKPDGALRVFTFGGSATAGLGYSPNASFARFLEEMLRASDPTGQFEVSNLGIVGLSSDEVKLLVADVSRRYAPDVLIVYSGNNEFLEPHARKYALSQRSLSDRILDRLRNTHLRRAADQLVRGKPALPTLAEQDFSEEELRLTQETIIREIEMSPAETMAVIDQYESNLREAVAAAPAAATPIILMTVASNWRWRGREDLPDNWLSEAAGPATNGAEPISLGDRARVRLTAQIESVPPAERAEPLFRRAVLAEQRGDWDAARADYRMALNQDPHQRRALDAMNERVATVADQTEATLVDSVEILAAGADHGIIGFEDFYDYVHLTPRGALRLAAALLSELRRLQLHRGDPGFDPKRFAAARLLAIARAREDETAVDRWLGYGFDPSLLPDRDLWKYDRMRRELDARLASDPTDARALVYRGNARSFDLDGATGAAADYRAALAIAPRTRELQDNLNRLIAEGRVAASTAPQQPDRPRP